MGQPRTNMASSRVHGLSIALTPRGGGGGTPDLFGFEISILGFFWVGKFGRYFFFVWLDLKGDLSRDFLGTQNN